MDERVRESLSLSLSHRGLEVGPFFRKHEAGSDVCMCCARLNVMMIVNLLRYLQHLVIVLWLELLRIWNFCDFSHVEILLLTISSRIHLFSVTHFFLKSTAKILFANVSNTHLCWNLISQIIEIWRILLIICHIPIVTLHCCMVSITWLCYDLRSKCVERVLQ